MFITEIWCALVCYLRKLWWGSVAILTFKSIRGERPIEQSSSWFPYEVFFGIDGENDLRLEKNYGENYNGKGEIKSENFHLKLEIEIVPIFQFLFKFKNICDQNEKYKKFLFYKLKYFQNYKKNFIHMIFSKIVIITKFQMKKNH